jgi:O-6-methylguanine DNA methyltransferase
MISIHAREMNGRWFGLACAAEQIVATSVGSSRQEVLASLSRSLPPGATHQISEECSQYVKKTMVMLAELEAGIEENKSFSIAGDYVGEPLARVLKSAASVPIGYVTSYGNIAEASGSEPRAVGRIMATNPLYPIVPCHRVVGVDMSLVGYRGRKDLASLQAKLARLREEARGYTEAKEVTIEGRKLRVYPVEWALRTADRAEPASPCQMSLFR